MQVSSITRKPVRPQVKRMTQKELQESQTSNDFDSPSFASTNRISTRRPSQIVPETYAPWQPAERPPRNPDNDRNKCFLTRGYFWLFGGIFCLILVIAIVAIVLGIVLPLTTTTAAPNESATGRMAYVNFQSSEEITCSNTDRGLIAFLNGSIPSGWTTYSYNYSAIKTSPILLFGFETDDKHSFYLDSVSVVDIITPSIDLLSNPSFENSTINTTDWIKSCETICTSQIVSGIQCFESSGNCFMIDCPTGNSSISFLSQSFMARIGHMYTISFMLNYAGNYSTELMFFYLDVI